MPHAASPCQAETPSLAAGIALAQQADIFVGVHGANLANGWLMRPGSSVVELTPYGFDSSDGSNVAHTNLARRNLQVCQMPCLRGLGCVCACCGLHYSACLLCHLAVDIICIARM